MQTAFLLLPPFSPSLHLGAPSRSAHTCPCGVGAGRRFSGAMWMNGYPAVPECGMDVVFVRCRQLLEYIIYVIKL